MICVSVVVSTFIPARAESVHVECEHITPPQVEHDVYAGYGHDNTYHWQIYATVVRCSRCNVVMQIVPTRKVSEEKHIRFSPTEHCRVCGY